MVKLTYWSAKWCGPCKAIGPKVEALCAELGIELEKRMVDDEPESALVAGIMSVPTFFMGGNVTQATNWKTLRNWIEERA